MMKNPQLNFLQLEFYFYYYDFFICFKYQFELFIIPMGAKLGSASSAHALQQQTEHSLFRGMHIKWDRQVNLHFGQKKFLQESFHEGYFLFLCVLLPRNPVQTK